MKLVLIVVFLLLSNLVSAQMSVLEKADSCLRFGDNYDALEYYKKALKKEEYKNQYPRIYFSMGLCYKTENKYVEAMQWFEKSEREGYKDKELYFNLGEMKMDLGDYTSALNYFETYGESGGNPKLADNRYKSCQFALKHINERPLFEVSNEKQLNTTFSDYGICIVGDNLFFASTRMEDNGQRYDTYTGQGFSDLYAAGLDKKNNQYTKPEKLKGDVNTKFNEGTIAYDNQHKQLYYMQCNGTSGKKDICTIIQAAKNEKSNKWEVVKTVEVNSHGYSVGHPAISSDGSIMYFVSDMPGGKGGKDIWLMKKQTDGSWGDIRNVSEVNSEGDEMFPYDSGDSVLYFSSNGLIGFGGLDIYKAGIRKNGMLGTPQNLLIPFNSPGDDFSIILTSKESGHICSNRIGGVGDDDIYSFKLIPVVLSVSGNVRDKQSQKNLSGVMVTLKGSDGSVETVETDNKGNYVFTTLKPNVDYTIQLSKDGYFGDSRPLKTGNEKFSKEYSKANGNDYDFSLLKITKQEIEIPNIYYDFDSAVLREESKKELDKLANIMKETPNVSIVINSHTDEQGTDEYNLKLSDRRANAVVDYLISKGITAQRLSAKGYGESMPIKKNAQTDTEHQTNRRTTFKVTKK